MGDYPQNFASWSQDVRNDWFATRARNYRQTNLAEKQSEISVGSEPFDFSKEALVDETFIEMPLPNKRERLTISAWLEKQLPPRDYLLDELLCTTSRWLIYGETGVGKTLFTMDLAASVASGVGFLNWAGTGRSARVMYLDGELPAETFKERIEIVARYYGSQMEFYGYCRDILGDNDMPPLNTPKGERWLMEEIEAIKPDLIVFDSIMCLLAGDMKDDMSWEPVKALVRKITKKRIAQIWLHHTGHDNSKGFGTKTREWEMDTVLALVYDANNPDQVVMDFRKARLRRPETREQFKSLAIIRQENGWQIVGDGQSNGRELSMAAMVKKAFEQAYTRLADEVQPTPGLDSKPVRKVAVDALRAELVSRGMLEATGAKGGLDASSKLNFNRAKTSLIASNKHVEKDGWFWKL